MANPFTTGPFNCCTCPEPPDFDAEVDDPLATYINLCGCPSVAVVCASEEKTATLCGFSEFTDSPTVVASSPPKKYKKRSESREYTGQGWTCCSGPSVETQFIRSLVRAYSDVYEYDPNDCGSGPTRTYDAGETTIKFFDCSGTSTVSSTDTSLGTSVTLSTISTTLESGTITNELFQSTGPCVPPDYLRNTETTIKSIELSLEDTEADALDRETASEGTSCSSLYELRTTSFSFTHRTVEYTATASNLVVGVEYEGCIRIQRREAYSGTVPPGANTDWEDVEPDTIAAFTATDTEEEVATDVALPIEQGYEYQIVGAYVWPTSANCDCPTDYVAP